MSDIIPPLISDTPPPPPCLDEEEDDEFGNFIGSNDLSYGCENFSLPTTPEHSPKTVSIPNHLDINSNTEKLPVENEQKLDSCKDYYDRRKSQPDEFSDFNTSTTSYIENYTVQDFTVHRSNSNENKDEMRTSPCSEKSMEIINSNSKKVFEESLQISINTRSNDITKSVHNEEYDKVITPSEKNDGTVSGHLEEPKENVENYLLNSQKEILEVPFQKFNQIICESENVNDCNILYSNSITNESESVSIPTDTVDISTNENNKFNILNQINIDCDTHRTDNPTFVQEIKTKNIEVLNVNNLEESLEMEVQYKKETEYSENISINASKELEEELNISKNASQIEEKFPNNDLSFADEDNSDKFADECNDDNFADFTDFHFSNQNIHVSESQTNVSNIPNLNTTDFTPDVDDFGDFISISTSTAANTKDPFTEGDLDDDDFGDFQDMSTEATENLPFPSNPLEKAQKLFEETFPKIKNEVSSYVFEELEKNNHIFDVLKDITDTPALTYQWPKSSSQKLLLKALNIDERNILPPWNPSTPIFAANLSLQPLEPIKSEVITSQTTSLSPSTSIKSLQPEIPTAQFDWKSAGLENPLETTSQDIAPTVATETSIEIEFLQNIEKSESILHKDIPHKPESDPKVSIAIDFSDFSTDPSEIAQSWTNTSCLRETHISNKTTDVIAETTWTNPLSEFTLPQTYIDSSNESIQKEEPKNAIEEDDFDDFQAAPVESPKWSNKILPQITTNRIQSSNIDFFENNKEPLNNFISNINTTTNAFMNEDQNAKKDVRALSNQVLEKKIIEDDEFTDFQSSIPISKEHSMPYLNTSLQSNPISNINSISQLHAVSSTAANLSTLPLEPLKPVPVYQKPNDLTPAQINWPDPGVTEDELKKFEEIFSTNIPNVEKSPKTETKISKSEIHIRKQSASENILDIGKNPSRSPKTYETSVNTGVRKASKKESIISINQDKSIKKDNSNEIWSDFVKPCTGNLVQTVQKSKSIDYNTRNKSIDDDEWTDFVSAQKPSPVHKVAAREMERTSSPDLPLSVFNLGSVQPTKQPIPVITPQGLVQTKLSANTANTSPKFQQKNAKQLFQPIQTIPMVSPSIISNQYVSQAYNVHSMTSGQQSTSDQGLNNGDDEWGDFVSSPLPSQPVNGYRQQMPWQGPSQPSSWTKASPNIITNPRHYIQNPSDINKRVSSVTATKKNMVPNLVLPELDFIAPKNRISVAKKK